MPDCLPSCSAYRQQWNEGFGCSSQFKWWMFPTPAECPCRETRRAMEADEDGMSDDDVIVIKQEEYTNNVHQRRQLKQQQQQRRQGGAEVENKVSREVKEEREEKEETEEDGNDESNMAAEEEEWTAILPVPLHYLCLRALTTPAFHLFLRTAMGQTERDSGVHVIMHQQPCDARTPLKWGHCILYGSKAEVERGKAALCAAMDSGYQHSADWRLLVAVIQQLKDEEARRARAAAWAMRPMGDVTGEPMYERSDDDEWMDRPHRRAAEDEDEEEEEADDGEEEEWKTTEEETWTTTEEEREFGVPDSA